MKFTFLGNCQVEKVCTALRLCNPDADIDYAGNSRRVDKFDPQRTDALLDKSDAVLAQPILNPANELSCQRLRARLGDRVCFMPYVYFEGIFSLTEAPSKPPGEDILNAETCLQPLRDLGIEETIRQFALGRIDFRHKERFAFNVKEMRRREQFCDIKAADFILGSPVRSMLTHNHPSPEVIVHLAAQTAARFGLAFSQTDLGTAAHRKALTLPIFTTVLSPFGLREIGLDWEPDADWLGNGTKLLRRIGARIGAAP